MRLPSMLASSAPAPAPPVQCHSWEASALTGISSLECRTTAVPPMSDRDVVVNVKAIGLNFADIFCVMGVYEAANKMLKVGSPPNSGGSSQAAGSFCPGLEFAGEAVAVGAAVKDIRVGERVYGFTRFGAYRTVVVQDMAYMRRIPDDWSYAEAAALVAQGLTAWHGLVELGNIKKGARVLVHSAAGGVGCSAMQICTSLGCPVTGLVGSESKAAWLKARYPEAQVLVRGPQRGYAAQLAALPGGGRFDCVLDSLGGKYFTAALESLDPMGRIIHFGATYSYGGAQDGWFGLRKWLTLVPGYLSRPMVDPGTLTPTNRAVFGFNMIWLTDRVDLLTAEVCRLQGSNPRPAAQISARTADDAYGPRIGAARRHAGAGRDDEARAGRRRHVPVRAAARGARAPQQRRERRQGRGGGGRREAGVKPRAAPVRVVVSTIQKTCELTLCSQENIKSAMRPRVRGQRDANRELPLQYQSSSFFGSPAAVSWVAAFICL